MATVQDLKDEPVYRFAYAYVGGRDRMKLALDNSRGYDKFKEKYNLQDEKWHSPVFPLQIPNELDVESKLCQVYAPNNPKHRGRKKGRHQEST